MADDTETVLRHILSGVRTAQRNDQILEHFLRVVTANQVKIWKKLEAIESALKPGDAGASDAVTDVPDPHAVERSRMAERMRRLTVADLEALARLDDGSDQIDDAQRAALARLAADE